MGTLFVFLEVKNSIFQSVFAFFLKLNVKKRRFWKKDSGLIYNKGISANNLLDYLSILTARIY